MTKTAIKEAYRKLLDFELESKIDKKLFKKLQDGYFYDKGDEDTPFFSEAFLYNLVGKEDARTILGLIRKLVESAGVDAYKIEG